MLKPSDKKRFQLIQTAAKVFSLKIKSDELSFSTLANQTEFTETTWQSYFRTPAILRLRILLHIQSLCHKHIFSTIKNSHYRGTRRVAYFLKLVERFLTTHPENAYWFKAYFSSRLIGEHFHPSLERFYQRWEFIIVELLENTLSTTAAKQTARVYMDLLKAGLFLNKNQPIKKCLSPAKYFLWEAALISPSPPK